MLWFVGLGLWDLEDVSLRGRRAIGEADSVFLEGYTSRLGGATVAAMEAAWGRPVRVLSRDDVESRPDEVLEAARAGMAVFLVPGDPMVSTTHVDLRLRAHALGIETRIVHGEARSRPRRRAWRGSRTIGSAPRPPFRSRTAAGGRPRPLPRSARTCNGICIPSSTSISSPGAAC